MSQPLEIVEQKLQLRKQLLQLRRNQSNKDQCSEQLFQSLYRLDQFTDAHNVLFYVDVRNEVRTQFAIHKRFQNGQKVIVPYCHCERLKLVELQSFSELTKGAYRILEPSAGIQSDLSRVVSPSEIDIALIPGVGFDLSGARLGHGKGYYDRLLPLLRCDCLRVGLSFDCQIVDKIPIDQHDQTLDLIVTPTRTIDCRVS